MVNSLNSTQNVNDTASPQSVGENTEGSNSSDFQKSADAEALKEYKSVKVSPNGDPITGVKASSNSTGAIILFVVVASLVLIMLSSSAFRFVMKRPDTKDKPAEAAKDEAVKKSTNKSKKTRSGRRKKK